MTDKFDTDAINAAIDLPQLVARYIPDLVKKGRQYIGTCPWHEDAHPSFAVYQKNGKWQAHCHPCGEHFNGAIAFYMHAENADFVPSCKALLNGAGTGGALIAHAVPLPPPKRITSKPPLNCPLPAFESIRRGDPVSTHPYLDENTELLGYAAHYRDEPAPVYWTWGKYADHDIPKWERKTFALPAPIYGLEQLARKPDSQVIILPDERTADAAQALFKNFACISACTLVNCPDRVDWTPIAGRDVILIPAAGIEGGKAERRIRRVIRQTVKRVRAVKVGTYEQDGATVDAPDGWTLADAVDWTPDMALDWAQARIPPPSEPEPDEIPAPEPETADAPERDLSQETPPADTTVAKTPENAPKPAPRKPTWAEKRGLAVNKDGDPLMNLDNVIRIIETSDELQGKIWYDEFLDAIITNWQGQIRQWTDADDLLLQLFMQRYGNLPRISSITCHDAAMMAATRNPKNECKDWITGLQWDGVPRLAHMLSDGFGTDHNEYTQAVGRCWIVSVVARVMQPGCKVDTVPVLEGSQGIGKSTALSILGGKWFIESHESVMSKDFFGVLNGHMLVEISEMHSFTRAEVERIKGVISCQVDRYRKAYGRNTEDHPRHTVLVCTTNRDDWQRDETGARRFWPVKCGAVNLDYIRENRDNLFAEAYALYKNDGKWWDVPSEMQQAETESRREIDTWEPAIQGYLLGKTSILLSDILQDCIEIELAKQDVMVQRRVGRILRAMGWRNKVKREGAKIRKIWVSADSEND